MPVLIILVLISIGSLQLAAVANDEHGALSKSQKSFILSDSFSQLTKIEMIPRSVQLTFSKSLGETNFMANPGTSFQEGCVSLTPPVPLRRLIFGALNQRHCLLFYERGGKVHIYCVALFEFTDKVAHLLWAGTVDPSARLQIRTLEQLRKAILDERVRDSETLSLLGLKPHTIPTNRHLLFC